MKHATKEVFSVWAKCGMALLVVALATGLRLLLDPWLGEQAIPYITFNAAVVVVAFLWGRQPGIVATVAGALASDFFITPPRYHLAFYTTAEFVPLGLFLVTGLVVSYLAGNLHASRKLAHEQADALQQQTEEERRHRSLLEAIAKATDVMLVYLDRDFNFVSVNEAYARTCRMRPEEMIGKNHFALYPHAENEAIFRRVRDTGVEVFYKDKPFEFPDQPERGVTYWDWSLSPAKDGSGQVAGLVFSLRETTRYKQAEDELRRNREWLRVTLNSIGDAVIASDKEGRVTFLNPVAVELTGWPAAEAVGQPITTVFRLINELTRAPGDDLAARVLRERQIVALANHTALIARDGREIPIEDSAAPITDAGGEVSGVVLVFHGVEEKRRAQEALQESEAGMAAAQRLAHIGSWQWDVVRDTARWSEETHRIFGVERDPLLDHGRRFVELVHPDDQQRVAQALADAVRGAKGYDLDYRIRRPDGEERVLHAQAEVIRGGDGKAERLRGTVQDITERKRAEAALRETERSLRESQSIAGLGTYVLKIPEGLWTSSGILDQIFGIDDAYERTVEGWGALIHPDDRAMMMDYVRNEILRQGRDFDREYRIVRHHDQVERWVHGRGKVDRDAQGRLQNLHGTIQDITERKRAEKALRHERDRAQGYLDTVETIIVVLDPTGRITTLNRKGRQLFGVGENELIGQPWFIKCLPQPEGIRDVYPFFLKLMAGELEGAEYHENPIVTRRGVLRQIAWHNAILRNPEGRIIGVLSAGEDITERRRAEEALAAAKVAAEQARETAEAANKAKDHFLAVLSHELRNPLNPVLATATMLQRDPRFDADTQEQLEVIRRNVELEARLIDDLLDVTRIERGKVELDRRPIELCTVIRRAAEVCMPDIENRNLEFGIDLGAAPYWVNADAARLQQVFWNLLKNAIKFTPEGGCVGVRCRPDGEGFVVAEVNDSGVGIEPEAMGRIFNAFEQAERSLTRQFGGLGLGLTISKALVELHGGSIEAHSDGRGQGATFRLRLPRLTVGVAPTAATPQRVAVPAERAPSARSLRILLVEDHGDTVRIMRRLLAAEGHHVEAAGDVATGLSLARGQNFDLLLSDLGLPDGSGLDLMRALRSDGINLPGIAISGYGQEQDIRQSLATGFAAHLTKPVNLQKLLDTIQSVAPQPRGV